MLPWRQATTIGGRSLIQTAHQDSHPLLGSLELYPGIQKKVIQPVEEDFFGKCSLVDPGETWLGDNPLPDPLPEP